MQTWVILNSADGSDGDIKRLIDWLVFNANFQKDWLIDIVYYITVINLSPHYNYTGTLFWLFDFVMPFFDTSASFFFFSSSNARCMSV